MSWTVSQGKGSVSHQVDLLEEFNPFIWTVSQLIEFGANMIMCMGGSYDITRGASSNNISNENYYSSKQNKDI